jgi:DNA-binding transcriptional regulator YiaG
MMKTQKSKMRPARSYDRRRKSVGERLLDGIKELDQWASSGKSLEACFTVRTVTDLPEPTQYDSRRIADLRIRLGASQAVFARLIGASVPLVRAWERGGRRPSPMARRLLDEIERDPKRWTSMLRESRTRGSAA